MVELEEDLQEVAPASPQLGRILRWAGAVAAIAAITATVIGISSRLRHDEEVKKWTVAAAVPAVSYVMPKPNGAVAQLSLPGQIQAWYDAPIFSRVNGYLKKWYFDYGAHVKAGDLLAEIEAPDLDASLAAARAKLVSANAQVKVRDAELQFAKTTYARWVESPKGVVSVQETLAKKGDFDSATARVNAALADVNAAQGEVDRLAALESFKRVTVPFDGVVTERNTDIGALINAGSGVGGGTGPVLFRVADVHAMRVFVEVPQRLSADIRDGMSADLYLPQYPNRVFKATIATTAKAISESSRTLLVELHADNADDILQPGSYVEVHFDLPTDPHALSLPTRTLLFQRHGLEVAVISPDDRIVLKKVSIGRNLGARVEILSGIEPTDRVVISPPDSLADGDLVRIAGEVSSNGKPPAGEAEAGSKATADTKAVEPSH